MVDLNNIPVIRSDVSFEGDMIVHKTTQPTEDLILEGNSELRKNPGVIRDLGGKGDNTWGRHVASIPFIIWEKALRDGFDLNSTDKDIREREILRFMRTPEGQACLVRENGIR